MKELHHIGYATNKPTKYIDMLEALGGELENVGICKAFNTKCWFIRIGGILIELVQPINRKSPIRKYLDKKGEGLHHIAFRSKFDGGDKGALKGMRIKFNTIDKKMKLLLEEVDFDEL